MEHTTRRFRKKILASSISSCLLASVSYGAMGQDAGLVTEEVLVQGVYAAQQNSINTKRLADSVVDAISAEDIGKLPDVTIADSLQRIPGIQVERTAGEGGPVQIRGLGNVATSLNGETFLSATTIDSSSADFGDLPSQLFSGAEVYKSPVATLTSQGISGTVNLKTRRPFDMDEGWSFAGSVEADYGSISEEVDPTLSGLISWQNEKIGILVSAVTTEKNLATDYNGYFDTSENGGIGATNNNHTWEDPEDPTTWDPVNSDVYHVVPQGFAAFYKQEERQRDGLNVSFQADLGEGFELTADYFYSNQDRWNRRAGFSQNNRWASFTNYAHPTENGWASNEFTITTDAGVQNWRTVNQFNARPYRMQSFSQTNYNRELSQNSNLELNYDNGGALTGQARITRSSAKAQMRHGYGEGDMLDVDDSGLIQGPGGLVPSELCGADDVAVGSEGGCFAEFSPGGIDSTDFMIGYDASGEDVVFSGFDQVVSSSSQPDMTIAEYMASKDTYHIGAFSSEGNTDTDGSMNTFSTRWNYAFDDTPFITSVDFGLRQSERDVDREQFSYFGGLDATGGCDAQWKAVDQTSGTTACDPNLPQGEFVTGFDLAGNPVPDLSIDANEDGIPDDDGFRGYTLLPPTRIDEHNDVIWVDDFTGVSGIPGVWAIDPRAFDDTLAFQEKVFGPQQRIINPGQTYKVGLNEFSYFLQANLEWGPLTGNIGAKVIETDLLIKQNIAGDALPHSGSNEDTGDIVTERSYTDLLPSVNLAYDVIEDVKLRFAYGETMQPLDLLSWGGGKTVGRVFNDDCGCMRVSSVTFSGNPDLEPTRANNIDFSAEWYLGNASLVSAALFRIEIDSFVQTGSINVGEPDADGIDRGPYIAPIPQQGTGGEVEGIELAATLALSDLTDMRFLSDWGFDVNYTRSNSSQDATGFGGQELPFINNSEDTYNFVTWWENDFGSARLAYNFRSPRLMTIGNQATGFQSLYQDDYGQLDLNITVNITDEISMYLNGSNITEEFQQTYLEFEDQKAFQNRYEARWALGVRAAF